MFGFRLHCRNALFAPFVLALSPGYGFALAFEFAIAVAFCPKAGRQRFSGCEGPAAVESQAHLPYACGKAIEVSVTVIMVRMSDDDVEPQTRVENKLNTADLLAAMPVRGGVSGRPVAHSPARKMIDVGRRA